MQLTPAYLGKSSINSSSGSRILQLAPDLSRDRVSFDAPLTDPIRFREAISALHDVVINDLRFKPRDKSAYDDWRTQQRASEAQIRAQAYQEAKKEAEAHRGQPIAKTLEKDYKAAKGRYWKARRQLNSWLQENDKELWRKLMPYDPVITVADDTVFFECFSADESSYGCLTVEREDCFGKTNEIALGTTNVDYSWDLYHHFQTLRSYRETRFSIDPAGFTVATESAPDYREEKIDLPDGWLRGFMQMQSAMGMPMRKVPLSVSSVYSLLAFLKRRKAKTSPRAIRFELEDGKAPRMVLEPWEQPIDSHGTTYSGPTGEAIRVWGRRRLLVLSRLLPLAEGVDVYLLGTGLPSFWVVRMGAMRLTLGLSGWTTNDWTRGSAIDMLMPDDPISDTQVAAMSQSLNDSRRASLADLSKHLHMPTGTAAQSLNQLALRGQAIYDLHAGCYRWRQVLPMALSDKELGPPHPERIGAAEILRKQQVRIESQEQGPRGGTILVGKAENQPVEAMIDGDAIIRKGSCKCSYFYKYGIRNGPCRHIQALRDAWRQGADNAASADWYDRLSRWAGR
ncbi:MAG: metal-binding protein [Phycisphaeraceae bacterium]